MSKYLVISSDTHAGLPAEQYREYVDPQHREAFDEANRIAAEMRAKSFVATREHDEWVAEWHEEIADHGGMRGSWDASIRDKELDADGVVGEVIFPDADAAGVGGVSGTPFGAGLGSSGDSDPVLVMAGARAHNRWLADLCSVSPERRAGVALVPILHDFDAAIAEIEWAAEHGLRGGIMIPTRWMTKPAYNDPAYDVIWSACVANDMPVAHALRRRADRLRHGRPRHDRDLLGRGVVVGGAPAVGPHPERGVRTSSRDALRRGRERRVVGARHHGTARRQMDRRPQHAEVRRRACSAPACR